VITKTLPKIEVYELGSQIRRAAVSITANIAESYGRYHYKENLQFCRHSWASLYECEDHIITCLDEGYINQKTYDDILTLMIETRKVTDGYIRYLEKQIQK
jgi:four helix bundle protein